MHLMLIVAVFLVPKGTSVRLSEANMKMLIKHAMTCFAGNSQKLKIFHQQVIVFLSMLREQISRHSFGREPLITMHLSRTLSGMGG